MTPLAYPDDPEKLDDDFVLGWLRNVQREPVLLPPGVSAGGASGTAMRVEQLVERCLGSFRSHHHVESAAHESDAYRREKDLLGHTLEILGRVLNLECALPIFQRLVEVDWLAHVALDKDKRYRDHVTHPARVTAIGLWLLHRNGCALLDAMATHYEQAMVAHYGFKCTKPEGYEWCDLIRFAWLACGLLHDAAFPLEYHLKSGQRLFGDYRDALGLWAPCCGKFTDPGERGALLDRLGKSWFSSQRLDMEERLKALPDGKFKHAHAALGGVCALLAFSHSLDSAQGIVLQMAAKAIVTHHDDDRAEEILTWDPLSRLLLVADNLQGWRRPFLHTTGDGRGRRLVLPIEECRRIELRWRGGRCEARFMMNRRLRRILAGEPYDWRFEEFSKPNKRIEYILQEDSLFPTIVLSEPCCVCPEHFPG